ncbi:MAG: molybdopterin-dependent oxidoreductase [Chloroflexi bacterium]|nr:molybdopterin-dependent oxidoreductase [Chloroflexota bacterium]
MPRVAKTKVEVEGRTEERYSIVEESRLPAWPETTNIVGRSVRRIEGPEKVAGRAQYASDIRLPGLLSARVLRSPHPHAQIRQIDASRAQHLPGVHTVVTWENVPHIEWDKGNVLLEREVSFHGDEVAIVVTESDEIAQDALRLIDVTYDPLPFVVDAVSALDRNAPAVRHGRSNWVDEPLITTRGDISTGFAVGAVSIEATFRTQAAVHNCVEPHATVAWWQSGSAGSGDAQLVVYESTQGIFSARDDLARAMGLPLNRVHVITQHMGGGFGAKQSAGKQAFLAAVLSRAVGQPVRLVLDREGENLAGGYRGETVQDVRVSATADGRLTAIRASITTGVGAYHAGTMEVDGPYRTLYACPNVETTLQGAHTNIGPAAPFRAPGYVEGTFGIERAMDEIADQLGIDPLELRRRNDAPVDPDTGQRYSARHLDDCYRIGGEVIGWDQRHRLPEEPGIRRGIGMASVIWSGGGGPPAFALVKINPDGCVEVVTGAQDIGTGVRTALAQVAAEELGVPLEHVSVALGDTAAGFTAPGSVGSMTLSSVGPAVRVAAADARGQLLEIVAELLDVAPTELTIRNGDIVSTTSGRRVPVSGLAGQLGDFLIIGRGARGPNRSDVRVRSFGAQFAQVAVDLVTGRVLVERFVSVHDVGRIINPMTAESQVFGGVIQGIGYALMERQVRDGPTGRVLNPNLDEYKVPSALDIPEIIVRFIGQPDPAANDLGAKGLGEPPIIGVAAAVANAVAGATGVRIRELPMTPRVVLDALRGASSAGRRGEEDRDATI